MRDGVILPVWWSLPLALGVLAGCAAGPMARAAGRDALAERTAISRALDDLHDAAARADEARYFSHFAADAVFLGTDATERWSVDAFRAYAHPRFASGKAWAFRSTRRRIALDATADMAWFDEDLATERLGPARGSGVLVRRGGDWLVEQYVLSLVVPNARFDEVHALLDRGPKKPFAEREQAARADAAHAIERADLAAAEKTLRALAEDAEAETGAIPAGAIRIRTDLAWLRWAASDPLGALAELDLARADHHRLKLAGNMSVLVGLGIDHDRLVLLREVADTKWGIDATSTEALAEANALRVHYARQAGDAGEHASVAAIDALFALRKKDAKAAGAAAKRVGLDDPEAAAQVASGEAHLSPIDLHFVAQAFELAKDTPRAEHVREIVRAMQGEPIEKAIVLARWAREPARR